MSWRDTIQTRPPLDNMATMATTPNIESSDHTGHIVHRGKDLKKPRIEDVASRLERIAKWKNHPVDDLLDWYKDDLQDLAGKSDKDLQFIVCEYLDNITLYRSAPVHG